MKFLDLCAGIGGIRLGLEQAGHKCVGFCEIDKFAVESYRAIHNTKGEWYADDITKITDKEWRMLKGKVDLICAGFPCQSFSIAGDRRGFEDARGTLFFDIARAVKEIEPQYILLENVKGLLNHDKGRTFRTILATLNELGYDAEWQVLNSSDYVPQNRERVYIIGYPRRRGGRQIFPITRKDKTVTKESKIKIIGSTKPDHCTRRGDRDIVYGADGISPTLDTCGGGGQGSKNRYPCINTKPRKEASEWAQI